jgi:hypothetical protein
MKRINKPDITREDQPYWEGVLESHGLGERQLGLQEEPEITDKAELEEVDAERH